MTKQCSQNINSSKFGVNFILITSHWCICCSSILSLAPFLFSFVLHSSSYINIKTNRKIKIKPRIKLNYKIYTDLKLGCQEQGGGGGGGSVGMTFRVLQDIQLMSLVST